MSIKPDRDFLKKLVLAAGAPGAEDEVRGLVRESIAGCGDLRHDRLGSILCEREGGAGSPRVVLDSHLDEVGFMVQSIDAAGRLKFLALGGWWNHVLLAQRVDVITEGGKVPGVVSSFPPHFLKDKDKDELVDIEDMYIDVGAGSREQVAQLGIQLGDTIVPHSEFVELAGDVLSCKAFDNRVGVGIMCEALRALSAGDHPNTLIGVGAAQEEVGCRGARTAGVVAEPDVALILEGTPADDLPGFSEPQARLGAGPQIRFFDPTAISNRKLVRFVQKTADDAGIPIQIAVRRSGGTDARSYQAHGVGVPTVVIGVPARYIHTHASLIQWQDYEAACRLTVELVRRLDAQAVDELVRWE